MFDMILCTPAKKNRTTKKKKIEEKEMKNRAPFLKIQLWIQSALVGMVYIKLFKNGKYLCGIFHIYTLSPNLPYYIYIWRNVYILRFLIFRIQGGCYFFIRLNVLFFWRIKKKRKSLCKKKKKIEWVKVDEWSTLYSRNHNSRRHLQDKCVRCGILCIFKDPLTFQLWRKINEINYF